MFDNLKTFFKRFNKKEEKAANSKETAKERLHLVLMQDRANVSADFLELMKQEIIEVIKKYIEVDEGAIDVRLTNKENNDGTNGAPALYANIPIVNIKNEAKKKEENSEEKIEKENDKEQKQEKEETKQEQTENEEEKVNNHEENMEEEQEEKEKSESKD